MITTEKPPRFKRATINASVSSGRKHEPMPVPAWTAGEFAIHRRILSLPYTDMKTGIRDDGLGAGWTVTHIPTGMKLVNFEIQSHARYFVANIGRLNLPDMGSKLGKPTKFGIKESRRLRNATIALANEAKEVNP